MGPNVRGNLTLKLDSVPWDQVVDIVLKDNDLGKTPEGNVLRIATLATLEAEQKGLRHIARSREAAAPRYTGEWIAVNLKNVALKDFFLLIQEISERKVVLDPDVRGRAKKGAPFYNACLSIPVSVGRLVGFPRKLTYSP